MWPAISTAQRNRYVWIQNSLSSLPRAIFNIMIKRKTGRGGSPPFPPGKLPPQHLSRLLKKYSLPDARLIVRPGIGRDAAVISFPEKYLIAKTDPITFATDEIGWYAVHVNANDVAAMGG